MSSTNRGLTLILASTSRYRRELLERLKIPFQTSAPDVDESPLQGEAPAITAARLALAKAQAVREKFPRSLIIGSDQVAFCEGVRLDKPGNHAGAVAQLRHSSGKLVSFMTALALLNTVSGNTQTRLVPTEVRFRKLDDLEIERYLEQEPAYDCAGSAKAEGLGIALIESITSPDPTALIGLPLIALAEMLRAENLVVP
ncbi:MAG TPA: Maf family nucleotide pyrophosphatase [Burkholderiales bacterium]|nr:Maf family nucleotide pyrophosphatase [Burkholderiales bacterium]